MMSQILSFSSDRFELCGSEIEDTFDITFDALRVLQAMLSLQEKTKPAAGQQSTKESGQMRNRTFPLWCSLMWR